MYLLEQFHQVRTEAVGAVPVRGREQRDDLQPDRRAFGHVTASIVEADDEPVTGRLGGAGGHPQRGGEPPPGVSGRLFRRRRRFREPSWVSRLTVSGPATWPLALAKSDTGSGRSGRGPRAPEVAAVGHADPLAVVGRGHVEPQGPGLLVVQRVPVSCDAVIDPPSSTAERLRETFVFVPSSSIFLID
jgi:hypothetical protein